MQDLKNTHKAIRLVKRQESQIWCLPGKINNLIFQCSPNQTRNIHGIKEWLKNNSDPLFWVSHQDDDHFKHLDVRAMITIFMTVSKSGNDKLREWLLTFNFSRRNLVSIWIFARARRHQRQKLFLTKTMIEVFNSTFRIVLQTGSPRIRIVKTNQEAWH